MIVNQVHKQIKSKLKKQRQTTVILINFFPFFFFASFFELFYMMFSDFLVQLKRLEVCLVLKNAEFFNDFFFSFENYIL